MKHLLTTLFLLFAMTSIYGQSEKDTLFLDFFRKKTTDLSDVYYFRIIEKDSNLFHVDDYFFKSKKLAMKGAFSDDSLKVNEGDFYFYRDDSSSYYLNEKRAYKNGKRDGLDQFYYETGELYYSYTYISGKLDGDFLVYYKNGSLKRKETYFQDVLKSKNCYSEEGTNIDYFPFEIAAEYKGGINKLRKFIKKKMEYPEYAFKNKIQGKVVLRFIINDHGFVSDVTVIKSAHELLEKEAIRVVSSLPQWKPAELDGIKVKSYYTLPINFKL
ncbi:MAG: TonB family protein [Fluviicola sp.]|nr:TonB family protein [Fluviicola sp.]